MSETKTILITGATSGIGLETTRYLNRKGYRVIPVGRDEEKTRQVSEETGIAEYFICDLEKTQNIRDLFDWCQDKDIKLDGLVHAAGYAINMPIRSAQMEHIERQMRIHYFSFVEMCKGFYSRKVSNDGSSIIALSSLSSLTRLKGSIAYASSKSALNTAVSIAAKEFSKRRIRVNALMPAYVDTRMNEGLDTLIDIKEKQPMGLIPPQNIAAIIGFLLSSQSEYITGALIPVSAGMEF